MITQKFARKCPTCKVNLFYSSKKHCKNAEALQSLCRDCAHKKQIKPKEEFKCFTCGKTWMDLRSQISNPDRPFCSKQCWYDSETKSLVGQRFGKLIVQARERRNQTTFYICECDCKNIVTVTHTNLREETTQSCGCLITETRGSERKPLKEVVSRAAWNYYKRNAKTRNYEWKLDFEQFKILIHGDCKYCDAAPANLFTWRYKYDTASYPINGIDRRDNSIGYQLNNCVSCCRTCNSAKGELSFAQFKTWVIRLAAHIQTNE